MRLNLDFKYMFWRIGRLVFNIIVMRIAYLRAKTECAASSKGSKNIFENIWGRDPEKLERPASGKEKTFL